MVWSPSRNFKSTPCPVRAPSGRAQSIEMMMETHLFCFFHSIPKKLPNGNLCFVSFHFKIATKLIPFFSISKKLPKEHHFFALFFPFQKCYQMKAHFICFVFPILKKFICLTHFSNPFFSPFLLLFYYF